MPRYIIQKNPVDCAPTAVLNAALWAGKKISFKNDYERLFRESNCNWYGTKYKDIDSTLRRELQGYCDVHKPINPSLFAIAKHIENGGAAIISYYYKHRNKEHCHIALFSNINKTKWTGHNVSRTPKEILSFKKIIKMFYGGHGKARVWLLSKQTKNIKE